MAAKGKPAGGEGDGTRPEYTGDKGEIEYKLVRDVPIEKKPVPYFCYGRRVRIAALHESHEQYLDHIIEVAGWARTTRAQGNFFSFVELNDGTSHLSIQVVVDHTMPNFAEIAASKVGTSYKVKGKLIASQGQN